MFFRRFAVTHSKDGWQLSVDDEHWTMRVAEFLVHDVVLTGLNHPCCGKPPFGTRLPIGWLDDQVGIFWYRVMNFPNRFYRYNRHIINIPLTTEQARAINPEWVEEREAWDYDEKLDEALAEEDFATQE